MEMTMSENGFHRIFIGCDVSEQCVVAVDNVIQQLKKKLAKKYELKWIILEKLHFTIRFIGLTESSKVEVISNALADVLKQHKPFQLEFSKIDFFPKNRPHVLAIHLRLTEALARIYADLNRRLEQYDIAKD